MNTIALSHKPMISFFGAVFGSLDKIVSIYSVGSLSIFTLLFYHNSSLKEYTWYHLSYKHFWHDNKWLACNACWSIHNKSNGKISHLNYTKIPNENGKQFPLSSSLWKVVPIVLSRHIYKWLHLTFLLDSESFSVCTCIFLAVLYWTL